MKRYKKKKKQVIEVEIDKVWCNNCGKDLEIDWPDHFKVRYQFGDCKYDQLMCDIDLCLECFEKWIKKFKYSPWVKEYG